MNDLLRIPITLLLSQHLFVSHRVETLLLLVIQLVMLTCLIFNQAFIEELL